MGKNNLSVRICESQSRPFRNFLSGDITDVPPTIGLLSNLTLLYGPSFSLLYLEQKIYSCLTLLHRNLGNNPGLKELPTEFGQLTALGWL